MGDETQIELLGAVSPDTTGMKYAAITFADKLSDDLTSAMEAGLGGLGKDDNYDFNSM